MLNCKFLTCILLAICYHNVSACDGCGCPTNAGFDLSNNFAGHSIFINYSLSRFQSNLGYDIENIDAYNTYIIGGRYFIHKNWNATGILPYHYNHRATNQDNLIVSGAGDGRVGINYVISNEMRSSGRKVFIEAGIGMKIPTGKYDSKIHQKEMPENFNPGNGSFGLSIAANAVLVGFKWSYAANMFVNKPFASISGYRYGSQGALQIQALRSILLSPKTTLLVGTGCMAEAGAKDINLAGNKIIETGSFGLYGNFTIGLRWKHIYFGGNISQPLSSNYSNDIVFAKPRVNTQINYIF